MKKQICSGLNIMTEALLDTYLDLPSTIGLDWWIEELWDGREGKFQHEERKCYSNQLYRLYHLMQCWFSKFQNRFVTELQTWCCIIGGVMVTIRGDCTGLCCGSCVCQRKKVE